ncbi:MAG: DUF4317 domain-containing protein [Clostridia bacterium]|nr:DUF4317 domain-containing protein [Clostridia bacterium]
MNKKEISEIKRRLSHDKNTVTAIKGCYVGKDGTVITTFDRSLHTMSQEDEDRYYAVFRRVLSGEIGQNLLNMDFPAGEVAVSPQQRLLAELRSSSLTNEDAVKQLYDKIISAVHFEENYVILLLFDGYDVPRKSGDGRSDYAAASEVFRYMLCAVCPVHPLKPQLRYDPADSGFHAQPEDRLVGAPLLGFMYPAFDDRSSNIYGALMYTKDTSSDNESFVDGLFGVAPQMCADNQREIFSLILESTLQEECTLEAVQSVQDMVLARQEEFKRDKNSDNLLFSSEDVQDALKSSGVSEEKAESFARQYDANLGEGTVLCGANVAPTRQFTVRTPSVSIRVLPDRADLVETRVIDGHSYIMIRADEDVTVNGVNVRLFSGEAAK